MPPARAEPTPSPLQEALSSDPRAAEFLLSLLATAAFSPRFATLLDPVPNPSRYLAGATHQVDIALLRADLLSLPALHAPVPPRLCPAHAALLAAAIFHPRSATPLLRTAGADPHLPPRERAHTRRALRFELIRPPPPPAAAAAAAPAAAAAAHPPDQPRLTAFHGSAPDCWYSILRNGLRVPSAAACGVSNGRLYGDAAYLSAAFALALAFAPHHSAARLPASRIVAFSAVGEFRVHPGLAEVKRDVPEGYIVVKEVAGVSLIALSALVEVASVEECRREASGRWRCATASLLAPVWERLGGFGILAVLYVFALLVLGRR